MGAAVAEWLSSWLAEQEVRGSIPGLAIWIFRDWLSSASKSRYGWKIAKSTLIPKTTNQHRLWHSTCLKGQTWTFKVKVTELYSWRCVCGGGALLCLSCRCTCVLYLMVFRMLLTRFYVNAVSASFLSKLGCGYIFVLPEQCGYFVVQCLMTFGYFAKNSASHWARSNVWDYHGRLFR